MDRGRETTVEHSKKNSVQAWSPDHARRKMGIADTTQFPLFKSILD